MLFDELTPVGNFPGEADGSVPAWPSVFPGRDATIALFEQNVYGVTPGKGDIRDIRLSSIHEFDTHISYEYYFSVHGPHGSLPVHVLCHIPRGDTDPKPAFLSLNFKGNHATSASRHIRVSDVARLHPVRQTAASRPFQRGIAPFQNHEWAPAPPVERGEEVSRWPVDLIVGHGFALVTAYYGDFEVDAPGFAKDGVRGLFAPEPEDLDRAPDAWGAIGAWAWGYSRLLDFVNHVPDVNSDRVIAIGHSRLGKAALWASSQDERFAGCIANNSGCGGAALFRGKDGEDIRSITEGFPHWFAPAFERFKDRESDLPLDQDWLLRSVLPRPLMVGSAHLDYWADPCNECAAVSLARLSVSPNAGSVDTAGSGADFLSKSRQDYQARNLGSMDYGDPAHWLRKGEHDITREDWVAYIEWAVKQLFPSSA